jgi:hypothetical protein
MTRADRRHAALSACAARALVALVLACCVAPPRAAAEELPPGRQQAILRDALNAYDEAVRISASESTRAIERLREAAAGLRALRDADINSPALEYNLGNVYFRIGDLGRAILHYRRAARLDPGAADLAANLRYARNQVEPHIAPAGESRLRHQLLFWHYQTSLSQRFWGLLVLSGVGWLLLVVWLRVRRPAVAIAGIVGVLLGAACGTSIIVQQRDLQRHPPAVVVGQPVPLRLGRSENADRALTQPLGPGVELRILRQHDTWIEVALPNNQTGWLPAAAIEKV